MRLEHAGRSDKGWYFGPWNCDLAVSVGYATVGIDEPHVHTQMTEIYLVASGTAKLRVDRQTVVLAAGDVAVIEPGEAHTFLSSSPGYFHFVVHTPAVPPDEAAKDKMPVGRETLGV